MISCQPDIRLSLRLLTTQTLPFENVENVQKRSHKSAEIDERWGVRGSSVPGAAQLEEAKRLEQLDLSGAT